MEVRRCACRCRCGRSPSPEANDLCEQCWQLWCRADPGHEPIADRSYLGTYGLTGIWIPWLMNRHGHLIAEPAQDLNATVRAPRCPDAMCGERMVARPNAWKCYRHPEPKVIAVLPTLPRTPAYQGPLKGGKIQ